ncbi:hypothetical protein LWF15_33270 [Kineosporia rhizophila]|uniref:hypothetical protein n=1 Tax=Kineosporia rhizophila TaxID=84633 RepID=UPI001E5850EE|nr:hypothetical protein [Kineosporia rhizophila]MCE0540376.1 hypothetical protein [Kineosporia rhizophila]
MDRPMNGSWNLRVRLVPPPQAGPTGAVTRVGATSLAMMHLGGLPLSFSRYAVDADELTVLLTVIDEDRSAEDIQAVAQTAGIALMESAPELADWLYQVKVSECPDPRLDSPVTAEPEPGVPDHQASIYAAAGLLRGLPAAALTTEDLDGPGGPARGEALRRAEALAGCLIQGADLMLDQLFDELHLLEAAYEDALENGESGIPLGLEFDDLPQLAGLPARYRERYTPEWVRAFVVAVIDLTTRLTGAWCEPACLAQDLAFYRLLDTAEEIADAVQIDLPPQWRELLLSTLVTKPEAALLYELDDDLDDLSDPAEPIDADVSLAFDSWLTPYDPERTLPPYLVPYPTD